MALPKNWTEINVNQVPPFFTPRGKEMVMYLTPEHSEEDGSRFGHYNEKTNSTEFRTQTEEERDCGEVKQNHYFQDESFILGVLGWEIYLFCGPVFTVPGYRHRGSRFDSRCYQIFWVAVDLERRPISLLRINEELLERKTKWTENWD
jgi:hypothetical protein